MLAPSVGFSVLALLGVALFVPLGVWQWHRGVAAQLEWSCFARGAERLQDLGGRAVTQLPLYQRVAVSGALDGAHQFLLDNRSQHGRAGYEVLTPLARPGAATLLIDRGWVPFTGTRARLPDIALAAPASVSLTGRLANLPSPGLASGRAAPDAHAAWPKVTSFPDTEQLGAALGRALAPRILLLDAQAPLGYGRDWQPPGIPPLRHFSYAIQWWCFAAVTLIVWVVFTSRRRARGAGRS
jgi:surfeit locus 1 family protein